ncbi:flagellar hook-length control protein FliK [Ferrimicrobium sp.]|uniref:flagellar hook-length control protein FliK n=1 Tax=Ferrimicrobium sp. TaxID=2926050 RepID=UPI0026197084|nr:flagellar hook-length control protein FliK [Ferrimicrobium sp.]
MSPVAKPSTTPLLEMLPQTPPGMKPKSKSGASAKERPETGSAPPRSQPTFEEVRAGLNRPPTNRYRPTSVVPITMPLTSSPPDNGKGHETKTPENNVDGVAIVTGGNPATVIPIATALPASASLTTHDTGGIQTHSATVEERRVGSQAQEPNSKPTLISVTSSSSDVQAEVETDQTSLDKARQAGAPSAVSALDHDPKDISPTLAATTASIPANDSREALMIEGLQRSHTTPRAASKISGQRLDAKASSNPSLTVGEAHTAHQPAPENALTEMNVASPVQRLDVAPPPAAPVAGSTGEAVASSPLGQLGTIVAQVVREGNLPRTITIALEPKELGQLQLQVSSNGGEIQVHIQVADPLTRGMVSQQLTDLTNTLQRDLGFGGQHSGGQGEQPQSSSATGMPVTGTVPVLVSEPGSPTVAVAHSLVDVRL